MNYTFNSNYAEKYGVEEAIIIQNFQFWIAKNKANNKHGYDGRTWTYNSISAFKKLFPFWTENQIRRILKSLVDKNIIITGNYNKIKYDRTLWYAFNNESAFIETEKSICDKIEMENDENINGNSCNHEPIPDINTDNKPNINLDINIDTKVSTPVNPKYVELSKLLYDEHRKHDDKFLAGKNLDVIFNRWAIDIRLLIEKDEREIDDVKKVIIWSQEWEGNGNFSWRNNILSGKKLREKFATLYGQYIQDGKKSKNKQLSYKKEYVDEYKNKVNIKEYVERQEKEQREEMRKNAGNSKPSKNGIENCF